MTRLLSQAAKVVDSRSARSKQKKVGASEIGVCRRRAGYSHHGTKPSNIENLTGVAAINGTWIHKGALDVMRREWGTLIETRVENEILRGHVDGINLPNDLRVKVGLQPLDDPPDVVEVEDLKTKRDGRLVSYVRNRGPKRSELFQSHLYAGMLRRGEVSDLKRFEPIAALGPIDAELIRLRFWSRAGEQDDDDQEYLYEQAFDPDIENEALEWVRQVAASSSPEDLPRDEDGPGLSIVCDNCPFRTACWGEAGDFAPQSILVVTDADLAATLAEYDDARTIEREAKDRKDKARKMLDASDPAIYTDGVGLAFKVGWSGGKMSDPKPDLDAMIELFKRAELEIPYLPARPSARTLGVTRWEVPDPPCGKPVGDPVEVIDPDGSGNVWLQDRPRGSWTCYSPEDGGVVAEVTAKEFAYVIPGWVETRPPCVLKKSHSGDCQPEDFIRELDVNPGDTTEASPGLKAS